MSCVKSRINIIIGKAFGEQFTIGRVGSNSLASPPDYTVQDQTPNTVATAKFLVETAPDSFSQINASDVEFFSVNGKNGYLQSGDILTPTGATFTITGVRTTMPKTTVLSLLPGGTAVSFKTTRTGSIYNGTTLLYSNIVFDYLPRSAFPGQPLNREIESSLGVPTLQVVTYKRNLVTNINDAEGLFLYQTDAPAAGPDIVWTISQVLELNLDDSRGIMILSLKRDLTN